MAIEIPGGEPHEFGEFEAVSGPSGPGGESLRDPEDQGVPPLDNNSNSVRPGEPVVYRTYQGDVTVQEFRPEDGDFVPEAADEREWVSFSGGTLSPEVAFNDVIRASREDHTGSVFLVSWEGNKIPTGARIHGQEIRWTQRGVVKSQDGKQIGVYDRLIESGGESGRKQQILIFADKPLPEAQSGRPPQQ